MAVITEAQSCKNAPAFLDTIAWGEGTSASKLTANNGYDIIVGGIAPDLGVERFTDYTRHPFAAGRRPKLVGIFAGKPDHSDAAGRYQIILPTWQVLQARLKLPDFSPLSQDIACMELVRECHDASGTALDHIAAGNIQYAIKLCAKTWASLPGSTAGQRNAGSPTLATVLAKFTEFQARYAKP